MTYLTKHEQRDGVYALLNEQIDWIAKREIVMHFINDIIPNATQIQKTAIANLIEIGWSFDTLKKAGVIENNGKRGGAARWKLTKLKIN